MIGLDTNILVRYLAQDDPIQSPLATDIIEYRLTEGNPGFISIVDLGRDGVGPGSRLRPCGR